MLVKTERRSNQCRNTDNIGHRTMTKNKTQKNTTTTTNKHYLYISPLVSFIMLFYNLSAYFVLLCNCSVLSVKNEHYKKNQNKTPPPPKKNKKNQQTKQTNEHNKQTQNKKSKIEN